MITRNQFTNFCREHRLQPNQGLQLAQLLGGDLLPTGNKIPLIWLEANACSGDSISLLNTVQPELGQVLCSLVEVKYWNMLMPGQGEQAVQALFETAETGGFILALEGAIATAGQGRFTISFKWKDYSFTSDELIRWLAPRAKFIITVGTCAAFGGPSAARPNPSGSKGVWEVITEPVVNVSGCPINPDWFLGTLYYLLRFGIPELDRYSRPTLFFGETVHSNCQRRSYYDQETFASKPGDKECMYTLGCMGPITGSDCPYRLWNDHLSWPVKANTPCIGCTKAGFPDKSGPFFTPFPQKIPRRVKERR